MASAGAIRAGAAYVELAIKDSKLVKGLRGAEQKLKAWGASIAGVGARLAGLGTAALTAFFGDAKVFADMGSDLLDMSQRTGVSVEALSELGFAADQSGADMQTLEGGLRRMQQLIADAAGGSASARQALDRLGISVEDLSRLSPDQQFKLIADRLSQINNPTMRAAAAMDIFGRAGTRLLPMLANGAAGIEAMQQQARDLGLTWSTEDAGLIFQHYRINHVGGGVWDVTAHYGKQEPKETGQSSFSFDTSGGTQKITQSLQTVARYAAAGQQAPDCAGDRQTRHGPLSSHFATPGERSVHG